LEKSQKKVTSPDPDYIIKRQRVEQLKSKATNGGLSSHDATGADKSQPAKPVDLP
jgi:anti-sigma28 factor (negative regulator of flagellin synthesis)